MELTNEQTKLLNETMQNCIKVFEMLLKQREQLTQEQIQSAIQELIVIADAELTNDFIQQAVELANNGMLTIKEFRNILHRVSYQQKLGNVRNIKGYLLNTIAKETRQSVYK